jgi:hypothetical protein
MKKIFTVYKTTNKVNEKYYIGVHKTSNPYDNYLGSGKYLKRAIKKYGIENFEKEILAIFETSEEAYELESVLVTFDLIESKDSYNIREGGKGGWLLSECKKGRKECDKVLLEKYGPNFRSLITKKYFENNKDIAKQHMYNIRKRLKECYPNGSFKDKIHTEETKRKIGIANAIHQQGEKNSQYGTCWIYNENTKENRKIKKEDLDFWIGQSWIKGRKQIMPL